MMSTTNTFDSPPPDLHFNLELSDNNNDGEKLGTQAANTFEEKPMFLLELPESNNGEKLGRQRHTSAPQFPVQDLQQDYDDYDGPHEEDPGPDESSEGEDECDGVVGAVTDTLKSAGKGTLKRIKGDRRASLAGGEETLSRSLPHSSSEDKGLFRTMNHKLKMAFVSQKKSKTYAADLNKAGEFSPTSTILDYKKPIGSLGYLLMIVNFTSELMGYNKDKADMRKFFTGLGYEVKEYINCTQAQIFAAIEETKKDIRRLKAENHKTSRIIVALMSHGDVDGLYTCKDDGGVLKEEETVSKEVKNDDGKVVKEEVTQLKLTPLEDIFGKFKHDEENFPETKGIPKFFIVQACHGEEIAKAAGGRSSQMEQSDGGAEDDEEEPMCQPKLPTDADFLVLSAATKCNKSFVGDQSGSWLVQTALDVFRNQHLHNDVERMLKSVTYTVAEKRKAVRGENGKQEVAIQVPYRQSTLRKDFFL